MSSWRSSGGTVYAPPTSTGRPARPETLELVSDTGTVMATFKDTGYAATSPPAGVYRAVVTQTGTSDPVAVILENTLGTTPAWTRTGIGQYQCGAGDTFLENKTFARVEYNSAFDN